MGLALAGVMFGCGSTEGDLCDQACDCTGACSDYDYDDCMNHYDDLAYDADRRDCADLYDELIACESDTARCERDSKGRWHLDTACGPEQDRYHHCVG